MANRKSIFDRLGVDGTGSKSTTSSKNKTIRLELDTEKMAELNKPTKITADVSG